MLVYGRTKARLTRTSQLHLIEPTNLTQMLKPNEYCTRNSKTYICASMFSNMISKRLRGGVAQWVACLTRNVEVMGSSPIKGPRCFLEQETLPLVLSTGWFQERIRA